MGLLKACVEVAYNLLFVHVLADEDYLLHAVSVFFVPVAHQSGFLTHQFNQVFFGGCGIPQAGFGQLFLRACLFKKVGHVAVVAEIAYAFGTDDVAAPSGGDEMVEFVNVECRTAVVNEKYRCRILPLRPLRDGDDDGVRALRGDAHALLRDDDVRALLFLPLRWLVSLSRESILPR